MSKLAIISGGSKGLGAALVEMYQQEGYSVVELSRSGSSIRVDLAQPNQLLATLPTHFEKLGQQAWDEVLLFNNAGVISPIGAVATKAEADIFANINVNFTSAILIIRAFVQAFLAHSCPKTVVNISSGAALSSIYGWSLYCGAKAGIEHFVRTVALEQQEQAHPITAVNVGPGIIDTGMQAAIRASDASDFPGVDRFREFKESGTLRSPETVAQAINNILASNPASGSRHDISDYL